jgi:uncharacterized membrane protein (UPF0136 family)
MAAMGGRFYKSRKPMPAIPLAVLGAVCSAYYVMKYNKSQAEAKAEEEAKSKSK